MKAKIGGLFLVLGTGLFVGGAIGFMVGYLSQDQTVMFLVAPLASASDWQMVRHDSRNTGYTNETVPDELELLRRGYDPKGWLDRFLGMVMSSDPLVADEKVFGVFNSELHAIDADTGDLIWSYEIGKYPTSIAIADEKVFVGAGAGGEKNLLLWCCERRKRSSRIWSNICFGRIAHWGISFEEESEKWEIKSHIFCSV